MAPRGHAFAVGGSSAQRLLLCPANVFERLKLPPGVATDMAFAREAAEEGSRCHDIMERWFDTGDLPTDVPAEESEQAVKAFDMAMAVFDLYMPAADIFGVEVEVGSILPGQFGTTDLVMLTPTMIGIADWKFGGWYVPILYGNKPNPQPMFYLSGLRVTRPDLFVGRTQFLLVISQPKCGDEAEHVVIGVEELDAFDAELEAAFVEAISPNPTYRKGDHCGFCAAKVICPKWTGPAIDLSRLRGAPPQLPGAKKAKAYGEWLGEALTLRAGLESWSKGVEPAALDWIANGEKIPGWTTVPKRAMRKWAKPDSDVQATLAAKGHDPAKIAPPTLLSPAQMEKVVGALPPDLVKAESSGFNLAPDGKPEPAPVGVLADRLEAATAALVKA